MSGEGVLAAGEQNFLCKKTVCPITGYVLPSPGVLGKRLKETVPGGLAEKSTG